MKKALSLVALFCVLFLTVSCDSTGTTQSSSTGTESTSATEAPTTGETQTEEEQAAQVEAPFETIVRDDYTVEKVGETLSLTIKNQKRASQVEGCMVACACFSGADDYRETLLNGTFDSQQLSTIATFSTDKNSPIQLPDPDQLIPVELPEGWKLAPAFHVYSNRYTYIFEYEGGYGFFSVYYTQKGAWDAAEGTFNRSYVPDDVTPKAEQYQSLPCSTYYKQTSSASVKSMLFEFSEDATEKQIIGMMFCLANNYDQSKVSATVPEHAMIIGQTEKGTVYKIDLYPTANKEVAVDVLRTLRPDDSK